MNRRDAVGLIKQGKQQVLAVHGGVTEPNGLGLGVVECLLRLLGQMARVHDYPLWSVPGRRAPRQCRLENGDPVKQVNDEADGRVIERESCS